MLKTEINADHCKITFSEQTLLKCWRRVETIMQTTAAMLISMIFLFLIFT